MNQSSLPYYSALITFLILVIFMITRYFAIAGLFYLWRRRPSRQNIKDIIWSIMSSFVFALIGLLIVRLWQHGMTKLYISIDEFPVWYLPISLIIYMVIQDTYFYWTHRWQHKHFFRQIHFAHHETRHPTAWTSFAFHPIEAFIQALILPLLLILVPINVMIFGVFLIIMSLFGITNHLGVEVYPSWFEKRFTFITASHHQKHHEHMSKNFGLYFTWWDRFMKTEYQ